MLLLTRKQGELIRIADNIELRIIEIRKGQIKIGIQGPREVSVHRQEVYQRIVNNRKHEVHARTV